MVEPIHMLKTILDELVSGRDLTPEQAYRALNVIMNGDATDAQIGGFLIALRMKGETAEEIGGNQGGVTRFRRTVAATARFNRNEPVAG